MVNGGTSVCVCVVWAVNAFNVNCGESRIVRNENDEDTIRSPILLFNSTHKLMFCVQAHAEFAHE